MGSHTHPKPPPPPHSYGGETCQLSKCSLAFCKFQYPNIENEIKILHLKRLERNKMSFCKVKMLGNSLKGNGSRENEPKADCSSRSSELESIPNARYEICT